MSLTASKAAARVRLANVLKRAGYGSEANGKNILRAIDYPCANGLSLNLIEDEGRWRVKVSGATARTGEASSYGMQGDATEPFLSADVINDDWGTKLATGKLPHSINVEPLNLLKMFPAAKIRIEPELLQCVIDWQFTVDVTNADGVASFVWESTWTAKLGQAFESSTDDFSYGPGGDGIEVNWTVGNAAASGYIFEATETGFQIRSEIDDWFAETLSNSTLGSHFATWKIYLLEGPVAISDGGSIPLFFDAGGSIDPFYDNASGFDNGASVNIGPLEDDEGKPVEVDTFFHAIAEDPQRWPIPEWLKIEGPESK